MINDNLISIFIPVYNGELYIEETIKTLLKQTYKNIEIIISDNCSSDSTKEIIESLRKKDNRIKYFRNSSNVGYVNNVNSVIEKANSEYIAIFHADDLYDGKIVEKSFNLLIEKNLDAVFSNYSVLLTEKNCIIDNGFDIFKEENNIIFSNKDNVFSVVIENGNIFGCSTFFTKKTVFEKVGGFSEEWPCVEDLNLWLRYAEYGYKIGIIGEKLMEYRVHSNQGGTLYKNYYKENGIGLEFQFLDKKLENKNYNISAYSLKRYRIRKSNELLNSSYMCYEEGLYEKSKLLAKESKKVYRFNFFEKKRIYQFCPMLIWNLKVRRKR